MLPFINSSFAESIGEELPTSKASTPSSSNTLENSLFKGEFGTTRKSRLVSNPLGISVCTESMETTENRNVVKSPDMLCSPSLTTWCVLGAGGMSRASNLTCLKGNRTQTSSLSNFLSFPGTKRTGTSARSVPSIIPYRESIRSDVSSASDSLTGCLGVVCPTTRGVLTRIAKARKAEERVRMPNSSRSEFSFGKSTPGINLLTPKCSCRKSNGSAR